MTRQAVSETERAGDTYAFGWWQTYLTGRGVQVAERYRGQAIVVSLETDQVFAFSAGSGGLVSGKEHDARMAILLDISRGSIEMAGAR